MADIELTTVPRDLYYVERALVERQAAEITMMAGDLAKARRCLAFFASVIKSGEDWSGTCQAQYDEAMGRATAELTSGLCGEK